MKKRAVRKSSTKSVRNTRTTGKKNLSKGALGAGMAYAILAMLIIGAAGTTMIGNIIPNGRTSNEGQPVILLTDSPDGQKNNLQLETFKGVTLTPTPTPTIPPPPVVDNPSNRQSGGSSNGNPGGNGSSGSGSGSGSNSGNGGSTPSRGNGSGSGGSSTGGGSGTGSGNSGGSGGGQSGL
jgi:uncharacterized membrane protein YgcG